MFVTRGASHERLASAGLFLFSLVAGLGGAEVAARIVLPPPARVAILADRSAEARRAAERTQRADFALPIHPEQGGLYVETPTGRRLRAGARVVIERHALGGRRIEIRTNSLGYRNTEIGPKRGTRLLFLGDSITFADYEPEEESFVKQVERIGRARGKDWETVNAGVGAIGLGTEIAILRETGLSVSPDAVVLNFYLNDYEESRGVSVTRLPPVLTHSRLAAHLLLLARRLGASKEEAGRGRTGLEARRQAFLAGHPAEFGDPAQSVRAFNGLVARSFDDWGGAWGPDAWEKIVPFLGEVKRLADLHGFRLFFVIHPVRPQVEAEFLEETPQRRFLEEAAALGVPALDLLPALRSAWREGGAALFYDHCHHTPRGSAVVAREIAGFLERAWSGSTL